jgi:hypothetical protein
MDTEAPIGKRELQLPKAHNKAENAITTCLQLLDKLNRETKIEREHSPGFAAVKTNYETRVTSRFVQSVGGFGLNAGLSAGERLEIRAESHGRRQRQRACFARSSQPGAG